MSLFSDIAKIAQAQQDMVVAQKAIADKLDAIAKDAHDTATEVKKLVDLISASEVVGLQVTPGTPTSH